MNNIVDIKIDIPKSYGGDDIEVNSKSDDAVVTEIPGSVNRVRKITIRGVLKHDTAFGQ